VLDRVRLVQDIEDHPPDLPDFLNIGFGSVEVRTRASGHVIYSFNAPALGTGNNSLLLPIAQDIDVLSQVVETASKSDPKLNTPLSNWRVQYWELAENRDVINPLLFTRAVAEAALEVNGASVKNFDGYLRTLIGPKSRRTRIYVKFIEDDIVIRHEIICERTQMERDFNGRSLESGFDFLLSGEPQKRLDASWEKFGVPVENYDPVRLYRHLADQPKASNASCSLDHYYLARSLLGSRGAMYALGISFSTVDRYNRQIKAAQQSLEPSELVPSLEITNLEIGAHFSKMRAADATKPNSVKLI